MCPDVSRGPRLGAALGLILPLALAGTAWAQAPGWVDPPARTVPEKAAPAPAAPAKPAPVAQPAQEAQEAATPAANAAPRTGPSVEPASVETERDGAAMGDPSRRAERPRLRRRAARRLSDTPAANTLTVAPRIPPGSREEASDPRFSDWAGRAQGLAEDYLAAFSGPNGAMVSGAARFYGSRLRFHGRMTTLSALLAEKSRFAQRWPERRYAPRDTRTACNAVLQSCIVRTLVDFRAGSPARGARSQGLAELVLEVSFAGDRPVIVSESSRVLRRGATVGALPGAGVNG